MPATTDTIQQAPQTQHGQAATPSRLAPATGPDPGDSILMRQADAAAPFAADSLAICRVPEARAEDAATAAPPPPPAWTTGLEPRPLPPGATSDMPALLGIGVIIAIVSLRRGTRLLSSALHDLRPGVRPGRRYDERDTADRWCLAGIYALLVICCTILITKVLEPMAPAAAAPGTKATLMLTLAVAGYFLFMLGAYNVTGYTFGDTHKRTAWLRAYNATQVPLALALAVPVTLAVFDPPAAPVALAIAAAMYAVARIAFFIKGFSIFYTNISSPLYFILYLCTLEITPMFILYSCALNIFGVDA